MSLEWVCCVCSKRHAIPFSFAADSPDMYANMSRDQRDARARFGSDQCIIDQQWFFIRGCLEIPILESNEIFLCGLWVPVREQSYNDLEDCWKTLGREKIQGPFKGRLANSLSVYPPTLNLKTKIVVQSVGTRPLLFIEELNHILAIEQCAGITRERATELASLLFHQERPGGVSV